MSSQTISDLEVMRVAAFLSPSRNTLSTISFSASSKTPAPAPRSIRIFISSSVTGGPLLGFIPRALMTTSVEALRMKTRGLPTLDMRLRGEATTDAIRSGSFSATLFGTSSPKMSIE